MTVYFYDNPGKLHSRVRELIQADKRPVVIMAGELKIPAHWLRKFSEGKIKNPGINRVEYLYEELTGKSLIE